MNEIFKKNKKKHIFILIIITLILPFTLMGLAYLLERVGGIVLGDIFKIISIDYNKTASVYEYLYLYSQFLNVLVMGALTFGLFIFAFRDFVYNYLTEANIKMSVSNRIKIAINRHTTFFHIPLAFQNESKKPGIIDEVTLTLVVNGVKYKFFTENEVIEERVRENGRTTFDTIDVEPFSATPIKGEDAFRKNVTFSMSEYIDIQYEANKVYDMIFNYEDQKLVFELVFSNDDIHSISRFKQEDRGPKSASNFQKNILPKE